MRYFAGLILAVPALALALGLAVAPAWAGGEPPLGRMLANIMPLKPSTPPHHDMAVATLGRGKFLVADGAMKDVRFSKTVILLIDYSPNGAMGLVINRSTGLKLSELVSRSERHAEKLKSLAGDLYQGGPVETGRMFLLLRSPEAPRKSALVFADVYVSSSLELLNDIAEDPGGVEFRVFGGYAGWGPFQLDAEVRRGGWRVMDASPEDVFSADPSAVWDELMHGPDE